MADERADGPRYFTAQEHGEIFAKEYHHSLRRSTARRNEDGSLTVFQAYELLLNPRNLDDLHFFGLKAIAAGYKPILGPVSFEVAPPPWVAALPWVSVNFFLEAPAVQSALEAPKKLDPNERYDLSLRLYKEVLDRGVSGHVAHRVKHLVGRGVINSLEDLGRVPDQALSKSKQRI